MRFSVVVLFLSTFSYFIERPCHADLILELTSGPADSVRVAMSGTDTVTGTRDPDVILNFTDFSGEPFSSNIASGDIVYAVSSSTLQFDITPAAGASFSSSVTHVRTDNDGAGLSDFDLVVDQSISLGDTFVASGFAVIDGLKFSDLQLGTYSATVSDAGRLGGVTLTVSMPEPSSVFVLLIAIVVLVTFDRRFRAFRPAIV